jgi:hypothetical protein
MHCRAVRCGRARQRLAPTTWANPSPVGHMGATVGRPPRPCRGQAVPDPSSPPGRPIDAKGCGGAATLPAGVVGSERPGLKPGRSRPGDRRYGRSADLRCMSGQTCRPRCIAAPAARGGEAAPRPDNVGEPIPVGHSGATAGCNPRPVGVRRCLTRPAREGRPSRHRRSVVFDAACTPRCPRDRLPRHGAGGRGSASPLQGGAVHPRSGIGVRRLGATPAMSGSGGA